MSSAERRLGPPPAEIAAALFWNLPQLQTGSDPAKAFATAFSAMPRPQEERGEDVLSQAAEGVTRERVGDLESATQIYRTLAERPDWEGVLGQMLLGWSSGTEDIRPIEEARSRILQLDPGQPKARSLLKLATFALDKGHGEVGRQAYSEALEAAEQGSRLRWVLMLEGLNLGIQSGVEFPEPEKGPLPPDPLVDLPWIDEVALGGAREALKNTVEARSRGLWSYTIRFGQTPLDQIIAAEVQATWVGALWLRRALRQQLGATLLTGAAINPRQWAYGVVMWTLGGGPNPGRVLSMAEPNLENDAADFIINAVRDDPSRNSVFRFVELAAEAWDLLSRETLDSVVAVVEPDPSEHPVAERARQLWAGFAVREPDKWFVRYQSFEPSVRRALVDRFTPTTITHFSDEARQAVFKDALEAITEEETVRDRGTFELLVALASSDEQLTSVREALRGHASAMTLADVAGVHPDLVDESDIRTAVDELAAATRAENEEARQGKVGFGGGSVRISLARGLAALDDPTKEPLQLLLETATSPDLPAEFMLESRQGLVFLRRAHKLPLEVGDELRAASDEVGFLPEHGGVTAAMLRIFRIQALVPDIERHDEFTLVDACRDSDPRIRQTALVTCAEVLAETQDRVRPENGYAGLAWSMVSGLFDPEDSVVLIVLSWIDSLRGFPTAVEVARNRLPVLLSRSDRDVRAAAVRATRKLAASDPAHESELQQVIRTAAFDRSWLVRSAANGNP